MSDFIPKSYKKEQTTIRIDAETVSYTHLTLPTTSRV